MRWQLVGEILQAYEDTTDAVIFMLKYTGPPIENYTDFYRGWRLQELAAQRYNIECKGITVPGIGSIATDRGSQSMITGALTYVTTLAPDQTIGWKLMDGTFVSITTSQLQQLASAVGAHVQACFAREDTLGQMISNAPTDEGIRAIDISIGWPV
jgi:hypothetical protein